MNTTIQQAIIEILRSTSWLTLLIVFWSGALLSMSSCTIVRIPIVVGYIGGMATSKKRAFLLTVSFVVALVLSYTSLGILFGLIGGLLGYMIKWGRYFYYFIGGLALFIGLQIAGLMNFKIFRFDKLKEWKPQKRGLLGAFLFGVIFAIFEAPTCPCCGPVLFIIASLTFVKGKIFYAILIFFIYALGQSLPIFLIGSFTGIVKYISPKIHRIEVWVKLFGGDILIVLAIYFFMVG